jgi:hypothetical protein
LFGLLSGVESISVGGVFVGSSSSSALTISALLMIEPVAFVLILNVMPIVLVSPGAMIEILPF